MATRRQVDWDAVAKSRTEALIRGGREAIEKRVAEIFAGIHTMPDGTKKDTEAVLDVWMNDNLTMLNAMTDEQNDAFKKDPESAKVTVEVKVWDEQAGKWATKDDGTPVTKTVVGQLEWKKPERTNEFKSTIVISI